MSIWTLLAEGLLFVVLPLLLHAEQLRARVVVEVRAVVEPKSHAEGEDSKEIEDARQLDVVPR